MSEAGPVLAPSPKERPLLLVRADASEQIGAGHVMRCLALAEWWTAGTGGSTVFGVACRLPRSLYDRLGLARVRVEVLRGEPRAGSAADIDATIWLAEALGAARIVVDHYAVDERYQLALKDAGYLFMMVDDHRNQLAFHADWVLNQNLHATPEYYRGVSGQPSYLLGPQYALLRREFAASPPRASRVPEVARRVLITLGGADPYRLTELVAAALARSSNSVLEAVAVIGGAVDNSDEVERKLRQLGLGRRLTIRKNVNDMRALMEWADVGITAAGSTTLEAMYVGLPCLLVVVADNQVPQAEAASRMGTAEVLGHRDELNPEAIADRLLAFCDAVERRAEMSRRAQALSDGRGGIRVVRALWSSAA